MILPVPPLSRMPPQTMTRLEDLELTPLILEVVSQLPPALTRLHLSSFEEVPEQALGLKVGVPRPACPRTILPACILLSRAGAGALVARRGCGAPCLAGQARLAAGCPSCCATNP